MKRGEDNLSGKPTLTSDKHDILYSRARYVLNQRHIKRPWFNLNPFLEKTDEQIDLEDFLPDESRYIQKLESLVVCENFTSKLPLDTRELTIGTFFSYIYSDIWKEGTSVRILEGQLFDQLLLSLYRLEKDGVIVRHKTYAFARNQRPRTGCYKLADKETFGHIDETLLIEFTYFGHLDKAEPNVVTSNPLEYLHRPQSVSHILQDEDMDALTTLPTLSLPISEFQSRPRARAASISVDSGSFKQKPSHGKDDKDYLTQSSRRRGSIFTKPLNAIRAVNAMQPTSRRPSVPTSGPVPFIKTFTPLTDSRRESEPVGSESYQKQQRRRASIAGNDFSGFHIPKNLKKLLVEATEFESLAELEEATKEKEKEESLPINLTIEDDPYYGEELYLSDSKFQNSKKPEKAEKILQRKKIELQQRRLQRKQYTEDQARRLKEQMMRSKPKPLTQFEPELQTHFALKMPEKVPTFEEFVKLLKDDEYVDPRYRNKEKRKKKRIAKRYNLGKDTLRSKIAISSVSVGVSSSQGLDSTGRKHGTSSRRDSIGTGSRAFVRLPMLREHGDDIIDRMRFAEEVHGVTNSEPCKEHCLKTGSMTEKEREEKEKRDKFECTKLRKSAIELAQAAKAKLPVHLTPDIVVLSPSGDNQQVVFKSPTSSGSSSSPMFPRISVGYDIVESPDMGSDEETDDEDETSSFDSTKLNFKYSIERLRKKKRKAKKRPAFFDVLRKYYRAQAVLQAFRKNSLGTEQRAARERARKLSFGKFLKNAVEDIPPPSPPMVIGKMKHFNFLGKKPSKNRKVRLDKIPTVDFSTPAEEEFYKQLKKSLKDFVVRREIVVSDLNARCATSITFTRKHSFKPKKQK